MIFVYIYYYNSHLTRHDTKYAFNIAAHTLRTVHCHTFQVKRAALHEMVEYVTSNRNVLTEAVYPEVRKLITFHCDITGKHNLSGYSGIPYLMYMYKL